MWKICERCWNRDSRPRPSMQELEEDISSFHQRILHPSPEFLLSRLVGRLSELDLSGKVTIDDTLPNAEGGFGMVYKGRLRLNGKVTKVAVKRLRTNDDDFPKVSPKTCIARRAY